MQVLEKRLTDLKKAHSEVVPRYFSVPDVETHDIPLMKARI